MNDKAILDALIVKIKERLPKFEVKYKNESLFQRFLGVLMFFNSGYMTRYTTTMFGNVYFVSKAWVESHPRQAWKVLAHEYVHLMDAKDHPIKFPISYALPQLGALGALLTLGAFWTKWALVFLLLLLLLAPWGSKGRTRSELRGYAMSMAVLYWLGGAVRVSYKDYIGSHFWSKDYYYMCRNKAFIRKELDTVESLLLQGELGRVTHPTVASDVATVLRDFHVERIS